MNSQDVRKKLAAGQATLGSWITFTDPSVAEIQARAGYDWLAVDMEHSPITLDIAQDLIRVIALCGVCPLVRVPANDPTIIKRVLDAGAEGIIVPMVNSRRDAENAVAAARYPVRGRRSVGIARAQGFGPGFKRYVREAGDSVLVVVQIEHIEAVRKIDSILKVKGIDAFMVGPYDLSGSMGIPGQLDNPKVAEALKKVAAAGRKAKVPAGVHIVYPEPERMAARREEGFQFLAYGVDFLFLGETSRAGVKRIRADLEKCK
ncbi:MAG: aldolase/citrate lyase family protein [Elusimicrobiota bacterium]